jgi:hypothetical protein
MTGAWIFHGLTEKGGKRMRNFALTNKPRNLRVTIVYLTDSSQSRR